jgi:phosphohistidine phosphatase
MKTLTLLRHAKSTWDDPVARDFGRPLNPRGRRAAFAMGREIRAQGLGFDRVVASPARRVIETLEEVARGFGTIEPDYDERVYLASLDTLLEVVRSTADAAERLLLVGHNPGMEGLAMLLTRDGGDALRAEIAVKYPTGALAEISLPAERWRDVRERSGTLVRYIRPRDLDPELGPDEDSF